MKRPKGSLRSLYTLCRTPNRYFSPELLALCKWISEYYVVPLGIAVRSALPAVLWQQAAPEPVQKKRRVVSIAREVPSLIERDKVFARAPRQRELFELLESLDGRAPVDLLMERLQFSTTVLKSLVDRGFVSIGEEVVARDPFALRGVKPPAPHKPSDAQRAAIDAPAAGKRVATSFCSTA